MGENFYVQNTMTPILYNQYYIKPIRNYIHFLYYYITKYIGIDSRSYPLTGRPLVCENYLDI